MAAQGVEINTVTYNSLLDVCARVGAMDRAASLLDDMLQKGKRRLEDMTWRRMRTSANAVQTNVYGRSHQCHGAP